MTTDTRYIYTRLTGYIVSYVIYLVNGLYLQLNCRGKVLEDPRIANFVSLQWRFFTSWNFLAIMAYCVVGFTCDVLTLRNSDNSVYKLPKHLATLRDTMFAAYIFPGTFMVSSVFWSFFTYDRNLILPAYVDKILTRSSNHIIHSLIIPVVLWELIHRYRTVPRSHATYLKHMAFYFSSYIFVLLYTHYEKGVWLYPLFGKIHGIYFWLAIAGFFNLSVVCYYIQWFITGLVWRQNGSASKKVQWNKY